MDRIFKRYKTVENVQQTNGSFIAVCYYVLAISTIVRQTLNRGIIISIMKSWSIFFQRVFVCLFFLALSYHLCNMFVIYLFILE